MTSHVKPRGEDVRSFILQHIEAIDSVSVRAAKHFGISRQAVHLHLKRLEQEGAITADGTGRGRKYHLAPQAKVSFSYERTSALQEDVVWRKDVRPFLGHLPDTVIDIWHYAFTEIFNNAIDHSGGENIFVQITKRQSTLKSLSAMTELESSKKSRTHLDSLMNDMPSLNSAKAN